jgi:hypothetical protein
VHANIQSSELTVELQIPESFKKWFHDRYAKTPSAPVHAHLKREIMQAVWLLLLDEDLMRAYIHGLEITCGDGVKRLIFPRFFVYSADYPEKYIPLLSCRDNSHSTFRVLLATIRSLAKCPCPRCFIRKDQIDGSGTIPDMKRRLHERKDTSSWRNLIKSVRDKLYAKGKALMSGAVNERLKEFSWVPSLVRDHLVSIAVKQSSSLILQSAFSVRISPVDATFNFFRMFAPDLMHEFELGVWKSVYSQLIRLLNALGEHLVAELNHRSIVHLRACTRH